jgi:hypothetical protein
MIKKLKKIFLVSCELFRTVQLGRVRSHKLVNFQALGVEKGLGLEFVKSYLDFSVMERGEETKAGVHSHKLWGLNHGGSRRDYWKM